MQQSLHARASKLQQSLVIHCFLPCYKIYNLCTNFSTAKRALPSGKIY